MPYGTGKVTAELIQTFNKSSHTFKSYNDLGHSIIPKVSSRQMWAEKGVLDRSLLWKQATRNIRCKVEFMNSLPHFLVGD